MHVECRGPTPMSGCHRATLAACPYGIEILDRDVTYMPFAVGSYTIKCKTTPLATLNQVIDDLKSQLK